MEKLFQVPSEKAQSPREGREKEGERINRKKLLSHAARGRVFVCGAVGGVEGMALRPRLLFPLSFIFSASSAKRVTQLGAGCSEQGTLTPPWTGWTENLQMLLKNEPLLV